MVPRMVMVTRPTWYSSLVAAHGTHGQARFFLEQRGQGIEPLRAIHEHQLEAVKTVARQVPADWRQARVTRSDLDRFLFEPEDVVVAVGQDGLVANVARYLDEQVVIGINPSPDLFDGVLAPFSANVAGELLLAATIGQYVKKRTMVEARLGEHSRIRALNELFIGQPTHQSAVYRINVDGTEERQSSSGIIVATGTGCTGWAKSIGRERAEMLATPSPHDSQLVYYVREAFGSEATATSLTQGRVPSGFAVTSEMDHGVVFGDGMESDRLPFGWGSQLQVRVSDKHLHLVEP